ncbi:MAG: Ig-like domain-containing protein [Eubacterium sp.]|nr:Ig-like domain-containing protein [Eubacterium sp.]
MKKKLICAWLVFTVLAGNSACGRKKIQPDGGQQETQSGSNAQEERGGEGVQEKTEGMKTQLPAGEEDVGNIAEVEPDEIAYAKDTRLEVCLGDPLNMPEMAEVVYSGDAGTGMEPVRWDDRQVEKVKTAKSGLYTVKGRLEDGTPVICQVVVAPKNWLLNPGFEKNDISMWKVSYQGSSNPTGIQDDEADAKSGKNSFYFRSDKKQNFKIWQSVSSLEAGTYEASVNIRGDAASAKICLYAVVDGKTIRSKPVKLDGGQTWCAPKIKGLKLDGKTNVIIGMKVKCAGGSWGVADDFALVKKGGTSK